MSTRRVRHLSLFTAAALVGIVALAGCSGSGSDDSSDSGGGDDAVAADMDGLSMSDVPADGPAEREASDSGGSAAGQADPAILTDVALSQHLIRTGAVELETDDVEKVVDDVYVLARTSRGAVTAENTSTGGEGTVAHSRMEIRVPVARFDSAVDEIKSFGTYADSTTETVDVTGQVADVASRVRSAEQSIRQLRLLFDQATDLGQIINLEQELSRRQADLEALQAKQRALAAQTTMSTILITVRLSEPDQAPPGSEEQDGFVAGIKQGWDAFVDFVVGASHAVGLLLPFALLAAVLGWLGWWGTRRFRPAGGGVPPAQPTGTSTD